MKSKPPWALTFLKFLTILTFLAIIAVVAAGFLVMIKFDQMIMILYSYYAMLPYLIALLTVFTAATIGLTVVYLQDSEEAAELRIIPDLLRPKE